jgi:hypothetical protein
MIIRTGKERLRLVTQVDHAQLCTQLAEAWGGKHFAHPEPMGAVGLAARIHDQGWQDWDQQPRIDPATGRPYDFLTIPPDEHIAIYERCIRLAMEQHPYAGLLVSLHGVGLYQGRFGYMPALAAKEVDPAYVPLVDRFVAEQTTLQQELRADLQPEEQTLWTHYRWLQAWDALSVCVCLMDPSDGVTFPIGPVPHGPGGPDQPMVLQGAGEGIYTVSPWPFAMRRVDLEVPLRYVPNRAYESDADFLDEFDAAPTERLTVSLIPAP